MSDETRVYEDAVTRFQEHITRAADGTFLLDAKDGESIGVSDPVLFDELKRSLEETNRMIRSGDIDPQAVVSVIFGQDGKVRFGRI